MPSALPPDSVPESSLVALHRRIVSKERGVWLGLLRGSLFPVALAYETVTRARNRLYDLGLFGSRRAGARVVSVGNLTAGGTGKTPVVIALARSAVRDGLRPAVLIRGYRRKDSVESDEARLLERSLPGVPVVVGPDRVESARIATAHGVDLLLLDDGFQHRRLARDVDIVLLDARDPFGGGYQLPRGFRREPPCGLRRAHLVVITRADRVGARGDASIEALCASIRRHTASDVPILLERHRPTRLVDSRLDPIADAESLRGERVFAFSGIGDPSTLVETLRGLGAIVTDSMAFADHHEYRERDLERVAESATRSGASRIVTTEKDLARASSRPLPFDCVGVRIEAEFDLGESATEASRRLGFAFPEQPAP